MGLGDDLSREVDEILGSQWTTREGNVVPTPDSLKLSNDAVKLSGTILYADLADSTDMVRKYKPTFAAEVYKIFLHCAAKIVRSEGGEITAYDGDRIMGVFLGDSKNTSAARAGLKINYATQKIVNPAIKKQYPDTTFVARHKVGIDTGPLFVARTGIRGSNDLVWVGRSANYAAKLCELAADYPTRITADVHKMLSEATKVSSDGRPMWSPVPWNAMGGASIYRSNWWWRV